jgi:heptosyltransferase-3
MYRTQVFVYFVGFIVSIICQKILSPRKTFIGISMDGDFGDIIASEPILAALKVKFGNTHITWIASIPYRPLLEHHPLVDQFIELKYPLLSHFLLQLHPFNHYYSLHLSFFRKDPITDTSIINHKADCLDLKLSNYYLQNNLLEVASQLADLGKIQGQPHLYLGNTQMDLPWNEPYWVIHTKSNMGFRDWNDAHWMSLLELIFEKYQVKVVEIGQINPLDFQHPNFKSCVGKTSLMETMHIVQSAQFFIGLDSGPTHMANAFQIPGLVLCGEFSHFKTYMPYSGFYQAQIDTKILFNENGPAKDLPLNQVWKELQTLLD